MQTHCIRDGQIEVGIIEHEGREFAALGATVVGRSVTGYTRLVDGEIQLATWCGPTMLACRSEIVERYCDESFALMFRLSRGRFIVGYALADNGMLFRGELLTDSDEDDARSMARQLSDRLAELDAEDEERWLNIEYGCPNCGHDWEDQWSCACDSECPECGTKDISALSWDDAER